LTRRSPEEDQRPGFSPGAESDSCIQGRLHQQLARGVQTDTAPVSVRRFFDARTPLQTAGADGSRAEGVIGFNIIALPSEFEPARDTASMKAKGCSVSSEKDPCSLMVHFLHRLCEFLALNLQRQTETD